MGIDLPLTLDPIRPMTPPQSPYGKCSCEYIGTEIYCGGKCPMCKKELHAMVPWPEPHWQELWCEEVFCWNKQRPELAVIVAAMYFEASEHNLLYYGLRWQHPSLSSYGCDGQDFDKKETDIARHLDGIDNRQKMNSEFASLFGADGRTMLETVLGREAAEFWINYVDGKRWRNTFTHRGRRLFYETIPIELQPNATAEKERMLWASLCFVPTCWVVFSKLWNEYIHKPMLERKKKEDSC